MPFGKLLPYRRRVFGHDEKFSTGSLLFDLHRHLRKTMGGQSMEPHKTRVFPAP
jgi:hypothetical protein